MSSNFTVIYDACVLYPAPLRDLIHDEWTRNVLKQRPDLKAKTWSGRDR